MSKSLVEKLVADYPQFAFQPGRQEHWSPRNNTITYSETESSERQSFGLLHELAHALLGHADYKSDFELLTMEAAAWQLAAKIGRNYKIKVDDEHIQNCLDTYRDWLYARSSCPRCGMNSLQRDQRHYECFNCQLVWSVSHDRFVRPYRLAKAKI